jgi:hypothetical protein
MSKIDLTFNIDDILKKYNMEYVEQAKKEILRFKKYDLERLKTTDIHVCGNNCKKNAIYLNKKNNTYLCWYHGLLMTKE